MTLLPRENEPGLQVMDENGSWFWPDAPPGAIVVNIGDMMKRLTNDVLPSTPHRVVNPPGARSDSPRYSIPYFMHPNPDFVIQTLETCVSEEHPNRYPTPITSDDYLQERLREIKLK